MRQIKTEILNSKEKKLLFKKLKDQWKTNTDLLKDKVFFRKSSGKVFILEKEAAELLIETNVRIYSYGNYFGTDVENGFRVSIEGSQIIGEISNANIIELNDDEIKQWVAGNDMTKDFPSNGFVIIKNKKDFYGCGKSGNGRILNYIPKARRIKNLLD